MSRRLGRFSITNVSSCPANVTARRLGNKSKKRQSEGLPYGAKCDGHHAAMEAYNRYSSTLPMVEEVLGRFEDVDGSGGVAAHVGDLILRKVEEAI